MTDWEDSTKSKQGEESYHKLVQAEIAFSRATGYDREKTAVVPLAELARREEERLRQQKEQPSNRPATPRALPMGEIIDVLRAAATVEEVAGVLVEMLSNLLPRILLFWERGGTLYGFASRGMQLSEVKLLTIELPLSFLENLCGCSLEADIYRGPPREIDLGPRFFELLGANPPEILVVPVFVTVMDRWVLYADALDQPLPQFEPRLVEVVVSRAGARADLLLDGQAF
jgi:hypothetical protein